MRLPLLLLSSMALTASFALEQKNNFETPQKIEKSVLQKSELTEGNIIKTSYHYPKAIIVEINDPGLIGTNVSLYQGSLKKSEYKAEASMFSGLYHNLVFMTGADSFGERQHLSIFKLDSAKAIFETQIYEPYGLILDKQEDKVILSYYKYFSLPCAERSKLTQRCWKEFIEKNHFSKELSMPKCSVNSMVFLGVQSTLSGKTSVLDHLISGKKPICSSMP